MAGGIVGIVASLIVLLACFLPFEDCVANATAGCWTRSPSLFSGGYPGAWAGAAASAIQIILALAVSILITVWGSRMARAVSSGVLLGVGLLNVVGFIDLAIGINAQGMQTAAGTPVGVLGSTALVLGGVMSTLSIRTGEHA